MKAKKERTSDFIKINLLKLLDDLSIEKIKIRDICEKSMIQRSTFYNHYQDKYQIVEEINQEICYIIDMKLEQRFTLNTVDIVLMEIITQINREDFMKMIPIQMGLANLRKDIKGVLRTHFLNFLKKQGLFENLESEIPFLEELFVSTALTYIEYSVINGPSQQRADFINDVQSYIFTQIVI